MQKIHILFIDAGLSIESLKPIFSVKVQATIFDFRERLRQAFNKEGQLARDMLSLLSAGELLTAELIGQFLAEDFKLIRDDIVLLGYPRTVEQFQGLLELLEKEAIELATIYHIKQDNFDQFIELYLSDGKKKEWGVKYNEETREKMTEIFLDKQRQILEIKKISAPIKWSVLEVDVNGNLNWEELKT